MSTLTKSAILVGPCYRATHKTLVLHLSIVHATSTVRTSWGTFSTPASYFRMTMFNGDGAWARSPDARVPLASTPLIERNRIPEPVDALCPPSSEVRSSFTIPHDRSVQSLRRSLQKSPCLLRDPCDSVVNPAAP